MLNEWKKSIKLLRHAMKPWGRMIDIKIREETGYEKTVRIYAGEKYNGSDVSPKMNSGQIWTF